MTDLTGLFTQLVIAPAKINLSLSVLAREPSGFHQIETIFCALRLADVIELALTGESDAADGIVLDVVCSADLGPLRANLAYRAAALFKQHARSSHGVHMKLTKQIPHGAGLGGGSSDAAAVLNALNRLHGEPLARDQLQYLGSELGSDVPFFVSGAVLALGTGRGERLTPLTALPARPVLLAFGTERVATAAAYATLSRARGAAYAAEPQLRDLRITSWEDVARIATNDFEQIVFAQLPQQAAVRNELEQSGALIARLTGTGAAVFGVFDDERTLAAARDRIAARYRNITLIATATARP